MCELSSTNDRLRTQLSDKERSISTLQLTISSLESRLGLDRSTASTDQNISQDCVVGDILHHVVCQLIADGEELDVLGEALEQVLFYRCQMLCHTLVLPLPCCSLSHYRVKFTTAISLRSICRYFIKKTESD